MEWSKVKRIFIYFLIVMNIGLFTANWYSNNKYTMSLSEERAIYKVLENNGIGLYTNLIKKTPPMRSLGVSVTTLDYNHYKELVFDSDEKVETTLEFEKTVMASDTKVLSVEGNEIVYLNPDGTGEIADFNKEAALVEANTFLATIDSAAMRNLKVENVEVFDDRFVFEYNERYREYKLFNNEKKIVVSKKGVIMLNAAYYTVSNFVGERREIVSCDEALMVFINAFKKKDISKVVYIEKIELGYDFQSSDEIADGSSIRLIPCYRIITSETDGIYTINAYTNEMME